MNVLTGIIRATENGSYQWPAVWQDAWETVEHNGISYLRIHSFQQYFTQDVINQLEAVFETDEEYETWATVPEVPPTFLISEPIANHPDFHNYTRTATAIEMPAINFKKNTLAIALEVRTFNPEGLEQKQLYAEAVLVADNRVQVPIDAQGNTVGEYDAVIGQMNGGVPIAQIIRQSIQARGFDGTIDRRIAEGYPYYG